MEHIGTQVKLPISTAFAIALQGIKIRLGRALVTISGVVLGIAFLMSVFTGELVTGTGIIKGAVAKQQELLQTVRMMDSFVKAWIGTPQEKIIAVVVEGKLNDAEQRLLRKIASEKPDEFRGVGVKLHGVTPATLDSVADGANLLLILGDGNTTRVNLAEITPAMTEKIVLDSYRGEEPGAMRAYAGAGIPSGVNFELFFGKQAAEAREEAVAKARTANFRTLWILIISLLVTVIGITNSLLMSVTERFKEIGTMKCLGALSAFIRRLFLIESALIGFTGSLLGVIVGALLPMLIYSISFADPAAGDSLAGFKIVFGSLNYPLLLAAAFSSLIAGTALSIFAAIYPADYAAKMVPAMALRSNV